LDVDVLTLAESPLEVRGECRRDTRDEDKGKDGDRKATHGGRTILPDRRWFKAPEGGIPAKHPRELYTGRLMIGPRIAVAMALGLAVASAPQGTVRRTDTPGHM